MAAAALMVSILALLIGAGGLSVSWRERRDRRRLTLTAHVTNVTVEKRSIRSEVTDFSWQHHGQEIVVRNDGPAAITITSVALAYGNKTAYTSYPAYWSFDLVPPGLFSSRLLPPGNELVVRAPEDRVGVSMLGPVVRLTDVNGRVWQRTAWGHRQLARWDRAVRRRDLWFEQQSWWPRIDTWFSRRMSRKLAKRPRRRPWELRVVETLWGYRGGGRDNLERIPWNAPAVWEWSQLIPPEGWTPPRRNTEDAHSDRTG